MAASLLAQGQELKSVELESCSYRNAVIRTNVISFFLEQLLGMN